MTDKFVAGGIDAQVIFALHLQRFWHKRHDPKVRKAVRHNLIAQRNAVNLRKRGG